MKFISFNRHVVSTVIMLDLAANAPANPTGLTVSSGSASVSQSGSQLTITASQNAFLNWNTFNIAAGETTIFKQPSAASIVWNKVNDPNPSQIFGKLQANGIVVLLNSSGFYFGPNSFVSAAGLVVSTANCAPPENGDGPWVFNGPPPLASIINYGHIQIGNGGQAFLIADRVENHGTVVAPDGTIGLAAGQTVLLSERPDGRGMSMQVKLPQGSVDNFGNLIADAGTIALNAKVINQDGLVQANSVINKNGVIELVASDSLNLGADSQILARGDGTANGSSGGSVTLKSGNVFSDTTGSQIVTTGGAQGGNGGNIEISAPDIQSLNSEMDASAQSGFIAGEFYLDPVNIILGTSVPNGTLDGSGTVAYSSAPDTLNLNVNAGKSFKNFSQIILQATGDITLNDGVIWNLSASTGKTSGQMTLEASGDITFGDGSEIFDANNWSISLNAGYDFSSNKVQPGAGSIYLNGGSGLTGSGSIQLASGSVHLTAGQDITVGSGFVITTGGGSVTAHALAGNIDTGSDAQGYFFESGAGSLNEAYDLSDGLGGISTAAGGDVSLTAGGDVTSVLPGVNGFFYDGGFYNSLPSGYTDFGTAGSGAYGSQPGNVTIVAGGDVTGHYLVANGYGRIYAGVAMDSQDNPVIKTDSQGKPVNEVDGRGNSVLLDGQGHVFGKDANGNPILLDGSGNVVPTKNVVIVPNGTSIDANGNSVNVYNLEFTLTDGTKEDESATAVTAFALESGSSGSAGGSDPLNPNLALSLISGGWNVAAAQNIFLQEVRNPNGIFDYQGGASLNHYFDYSADSYVNLAAGNQIQLGASSSALPRQNANDGINVPVIYPSILNLTAGAGGVILDGDSTFNQLILFPSPEGGLTINTTQGGSLISTLPAIGLTPQIFNLIVSDSGRKQYVSAPGLPLNDLFGLNDHASTPIHEGSTTPITLNISGNMSLVLLSAPEAAQITVGGNMDNSRFQGMNLLASDVTSINVAGDINNRSAFTSAMLDLSPNSDEQAPDLSFLSKAVYNTVDGKPISAAALVTSFFYNPTTQTLTYQNITGLSAASVINLLQNLTVQLYINGVPQYEDPPGSKPTGPYNTIPTPDPNKVPVLNAATAQALLTEYNNENGMNELPDGVGPPAGGSGYTIGGGGKFNISSRNMELGTTTGIQSLGVGLYQVGSSYPLAKLFDTGADISVNTMGDLNMFSTSISSLNGGAVQVNVGVQVEDDGSLSVVNPAAQLNVGSKDFTVAALGTRGIFSTSSGAVSVYAGGNININGSRIASYDGGKVTVESFNGNLDAGTGGSGYLVVQKYSAKDGNVAYSQATIPGSGILATTFPNSSSPVGDILVETPNGNISANAGGIVELPLNNVSTPNAIVTLLAGYELQDGIPVLVSPNRDIDVSGSGVIAQNASLRASGNVNGLIFAATGNIDLAAQGNVNVTALAQGTANVDAGGKISGTIIGIGGITANSSSGSIDANLISNNSISGETSGQSGTTQGTAANATSAAASNENATQNAATTTGDDDTTDDKKNKKPITLAQKVGRVTVLLPNKTN
jgi:filamentous hemagglutinin family protein